MNAEQIENKLDSYRQGLQWMEQKHGELVDSLKRLEAAMLKQQGAIESLEGILGAGEDAGQDEGASLAGNAAREN